jgi:predicted nucleic acid-binding protein
VKSAIIDSSVFLSLVDPDEQHHKASRTAFEDALSSSVTLAATNFIFDEAYTLILARLGRERALAWGEALRRSAAVQLIRVTQAHEERTWEILNAYDDKYFSYTDATTFAVAEMMGIDGALSLDQHFVQWGQLEVLPR